LRKKVNTANQLSKYIYLLNDSHNFNKKVEFRGGFYLKPRTIFWEWLLLGKESPLRIKYPNLFFPFPELQFKIDNTFPYSGKVQKFKKRRRPTNLSLDEFDSIGRSLALCLFFGLSDLHKNNVVLYKSKKIFYFFPIDIECIFYNYLLASQSSLLFHDNLKINESGLFFLKKIKINHISLSRILFGFLNHMELLEKQKINIARLLKRIIKNKKIPIRVVLRDTREYYAQLEKMRNIQKFHPQEIEQIKRKDIPYFFSFPNQSKIYFYKNNLFEFSQIKNLKKYGLIPPTLSRKFFPNSSKSKIYTTLQLASKLSKSFKIRGQTSIKKFCFTFMKRKTVLKINGEKYEAHI
jgi:antitoxin component of RelBE/YafQ-DinJ toxin-antitoxin module